MSNFDKEKQDIAYFSAGCFWCVEAIFQRIKGVISVKSGYCNGQTSNPNYQEICTGRTGHAEAIEVIFKIKTVNYKTLLKVFFATHDPTTLNRQGNDIGTQYRSGVFYTNDIQKKIAKEIITNLPNAGNIKTEISPIDIFYPAENYHQNYFNDNQSAPYCQAIIAPKLNKYFK